MTFSAVIFLSLLVTGLSISDHVTNSLMGRESKKPVMARFLSEDRLQFEFFGYSYILNTKNIREDWDGMRESIGGRWSALVDSILARTGIEK
jgi:hypothetical protein